MNRSPLREAEMLGVSRSSPNKQYAYWLRNVIEWQDIWVLEGLAGWYMYQSPSGTECICVWPHEAYASWYAQNVEASKKLHPVTIPWQTFIGEFMPALATTGRKIAIGPFLGTSAVIKEPSDVLRDIQRQFSFRV